MKLCCLWLAGSIASAQNSQEIHLNFAEILDAFNEFVSKFSASLFALSGITSGIFNFLLTSFGKKFLAHHKYSMRLMILAKRTKIKIFVVKMTQIELQHKICMKERMSDVHPTIIDKILCALIVKFRSTQ